MESNKNITAELGDATEALIESYQSGGVNGLKDFKLPSKISIATILQSLLSLLFPGFFDERNITAKNIHSVTGEQVFSLFQKLSEEIARGEGFQCKQRPTDEKEDEFLEKGRLATMKLLKTLPKIRAALTKDVDAIFMGDPAAKSRSEVILAYPGLYAIAAYRVANVLYKMNVPLIPRMMTEIVHHSTGIDINPGADIGESFFIDHGTGIVIGETTKIGDNVKLYHGVTLGAFAVDKKMSGTKRHPTIGNSVTIYSGATILGGDTIVGNNSLIGANVWLTKSVPENSKVK